MMAPSRPVVALVTGGSRGIGSVIALQLARRGVRIALHYRNNREAAERTAALLAGTGHAIFAADLADPDGAVRLWREVNGQLGSIDVLVNNAGLYMQHSPSKTAYADWQSAWRRTLAANLLAPANLSLLAAQSMASRADPADAAFGRGRIVNISSRGAFRGEPDAPAYGASKAALNSMSQSLAKALAPQGVYVFGLAPGWVSTDMAIAHITGAGGAELLAQHPLGRVATPEEIAAAATFCAL